MSINYHPAPARKPSKDAPSEFVARYARSVDGHRSPKSRSILSEIDELLSQDVEGTRRDAIALVASWIDAANKAVPVEYKRDEDGRVWMCVEPGRPCLDRLINEIKTSGTIKILMLVDVARTAIRPNGQIPQYQQIENALATQLRDCVSCQEVPRDNQ